MNASEDEITSDGLLNVLVQCAGTFLFMVMAAGWKEVNQED